MTAVPERNIVVQIYRTRSSRLRRKTQYRFRIVSSNGRVLAVSSESYNNQQDAATAASTVVGVPVRLR